MGIFKRNEGAITVYICILISIMLVLTGVLVDGARARVAESQVQNVTEAAANSLLANYNNILKEWFGLMAMSENNPGVLEEELMYYLNRNLMTELGAEKKNLSDASWDYAKKFFNIENKYESVRFLDMYDYRLEEVKAVPLYNLAENEVLRAQIVDYMKYRAPEILAEEFLEKINVFKSYKKQAKVLSSKLELDKSMDEISKELAKLYDKIKQVNSYDQDGFKKMLDTAGDRILIKLSKEKVYIEYKKATEEVEKALSEHRKSDTYISERQRLREELKLAEDKSEKDEIRQQIDDLDEPYLSMLNTAEEEEEDAKNEYLFCRNSAKNAIDAVFDYIKEYSSYNEAAIKIAERIKENCADMKDKKIGDLKAQIKDDNSDFAEKMRQEIKRIEAQVSKESMQHLVDKFTENKNMLEELNKTLVGLELYDIHLDPDSPSAINTEEFGYIMKEFKASILPVEKLYSNYLVKYSKVSYEEFPVDNTSTGEEKVKDPRDASKNLVVGSDNPLKTIEAPEAHEDFKEVRKGLPSGGAKIDSEEILKAFLGENYDFALKAIGAKDDTEGKEPEVGEPKDIIEKMNFKNDDSESLSGGLGILATLIEILENGLETVRDEIFVDEYALGTFNNYLSTKDLKVKDGNTISQVDLRLRNRSERKPYMYFENEIEYIIGGSDNEKTNVSNVQSKILLIRFTLNTLHIYLDPVKMKDVYTIAGSIAGIGGPLVAAFAVHLIAALIVMGWSMAESVFDLKLLMKGESVPIFKTSKNWILSAQGGLNKLQEKITDTVVDGAKEYSKEFLNDKIDGIEGDLKSYTANIKDTINVKIDNIVEKVFEPVDNALNDADKTIKDTYSQITENLENELFNTSNESMNIITKKIYEIAQEEYQKAKGEIQNKLTMPLDKAKAEIEKIKQSIKNTVDEKVSGMEEAINKEIRKAAQEGKEKLNGYIDSFGDKNPTSTIVNNNFKASVLSFNYEEYLRLFLLTTNRNEKITRIQDLIQLQMVKMTGNEEFKLSNCNTHVGVITNVSMKYFFMTQAFVTKELKTEELDRHNLYVMLFKGY